MGQSLNYADLFSNCTSTTVDTSIGAGGPPCETQGLSIETASACESQINAVGSSYAFNQIHCYPELSFPPGLQSMDPAWARCDSDPYGGHFAFVFDFPRALTPATAMVPAPTKSPATQPSPSPAPLPLPPGPAQTAPPSSSPIAKPPGNGPGNAGGDPNSGKLGSGSPSNGSPSNGNGSPGNGNSGHGSPSNGNGSPSSGESGNPGNGSPSNGRPGAGDPGKGGFTDNNSPINPNNETPAQVSALHQDLGPALSPDAQPPSAAQSNDATQPGEDPKGNASPPANSPATNGGSYGPGSGSSSSGGQNSGDPKVNDPSRGGSDDPNQPSPKAPVGGQPPATPPSFTIVNPVGPNLLGTVINPGSVLIGGVTIGAGATAVQVSNHQISLDPGASNIVVDGKSHSLPSPNPQRVYTYTPVPTSLFTIGNQAITLSSKILIAAGSTLGTANGPAFTIAGTVVPLDSSVLRIGTSSITLVVPPPPTAAPRMILVADQPATILLNGVAIAGITLTPNAPAITVSGTPISLGASSLIIGTSTIPVSLGVNGLVVGTSTIAYQNIGSTTAGGIGGLVFSGMNGGFATPAANGAGIANGTQVETFRGSGSELRILWSRLGILVALTVMFVGLGSAMW